MYAFQSSFHVELICDTYDTLSPFFSNPAQCRRTSITIWAAGYTPQVMSDWIMCVCVLLYLLSPSKPSPMSYLSEICPVGLHYYKYYNNINFNIIPKPSLLLTVRQLSCIVSEKLALAGSRTRVSKGIRPGVLTTRPPVPGRHNSASAHSQFLSHAA